MDALNGVTSYGYDANGNQVTLTDPVGNRTTSVFDALDRVVSVTDPLNHASTTAYDAVGRVASATDGLGRRRDYAYDADGRLTAEAWVSAGVTQAVSTYAYDAADRRTVARNAAGAYTLTYDDADRVRTVAGPFGVAMTFAYDASGNRTLVQDSTGGTTTSAFDAADRLTSRQLGGAGIAAERVDWEYTARGMVGTMTRYSDLAGTTVVARTVTSYDADSRVTGIVTANAGGATLSAFTYTLDAGDRITQKADDGTPTSYAYDPTDQLTADGATGYAYDANGNRTGVGYSTGAGNQTTADGTWTYTYDAEGSVTKRTKGLMAETWQYGYDQRGQMVSAIKSATDGGTATTRVTYVYDAFGNRIETDTWDGTTTTVERYAFDGWDTTKPSPVGNENFDAWADLDGSNALVTRRVYGAGFDELVARQSAVGTVAWYLADHQGSVRQLIDNSGSVIGTLAYDAFGKVTASSGLFDRIQFTGREWDAVLGLQYSRARIYNPSTGKFQTADSAGFAAGDVNLYRYVGNNPTNATDPSGQWVQLLWVGGRWVVMRAAPWVWSNAIRPAAVWTYQNAIRPAAVWTYQNAIRPAAVWTYQNALQPTGQFLGSLPGLAYRNVLQPVGQFAGSLPGLAYRNVLQPIGQGVGSAASFLYNNFLPVSGVTPFAQQLLLKGQQTVQQVSWGGYNFFSAIGQPVLRVPERIAIFKDLMLQNKFPWIHPTEPIKITKIGQNIYVWEGHTRFQAAYESGFLQKFLDAAVRVQELPLSPNAGMPFFRFFGQ